MNDFEQLAYTDTLRIPKAGDEVCIRFKGQPFRKERLVRKIAPPGGEGNVFSTEHYGSMVIKLYHPEKLTRGRVEKITALAEEIQDVNSQIFDYICWPKAVVYDYEQGHMVGYLMERVPEDALPLEEIISQMAVGGNPLGYDRRDLAELCKRIAQRFSLLHSLAQKRLLMCDVNPTNILISPRTKQVYFVDLDSYQYESNAGKRLRCPVGRGEYTSPELYERMRFANTVHYADVDRTEVDEAFAAAVLYFDILMLGREPFDRFGESYEDVIRQGKFTYRNGRPTCYIWKNLTPRLQQMFRSVFMNRAVYSDRDWIDAFTMLQAGIEDNMYSRELRPNTYPEFEGDRLVQLKCRRCGVMFSGSAQIYHNYYPYCKECLRTVNREERQCQWVSCSRCGQQFVRNEADRKVEEDVPAICPDCDPGYYILRKKLFEDPRGNSQELVAAAMKNWKER